jgi:hypothetical protein
MLNEVAVANGGQIVVTRGHQSRSVSFDPLARTAVNGFPVCPLGLATMGGVLVASASLVSLILTVDGLPLILVGPGSQVVLADGFSGALTPAVSAGTGFLTE